jgi:hypothetical protein
MEIQEKADLKGKLKVALVAKLCGSRHGGRTPHALSTGRLYAGFEIMTSNFCFRW